MELLEAIKKHEKDFEKWWFDGEDFSPSLEEALVEVYEDVMPPGIGIQKELIAIQVSGSTIMYHKMY